MRRIVLVVLLAACAGADGGERWTGSVDTLTNGAVRVTSPSRGMWEDGTPWRLAPALVIGEEDGADATVFGVISGLEVDAAGRIYVLDRQANELRIFAPDGRFVRSVGREGDGPGEYRNANGLRWLTADTLVVVDQRANRYTVLDAEGAYIRTVPRRLGFYGWVFTGGLDAGTIYERWYVGELTPDGEPRQLALLARPLQARAIPMETDAGATPDAVVLLEVARDTLLLPPFDGPLVQSFSVQTSRGGMSMEVPFAPNPVFHLDGRGGLWIGHGSQFRILKTSLAGDTVMEVLLDVEPAPVTPDELAEWEAGLFVKQFRDMGGDLDLDRIPKAKPFFDAFHVDPDRHLWVSVPVGPMATMFRVFDPAGRYLGALTAAGVQPDPFVPIVVRGNRLHMIGRDALDVQRVHVFAIER